MAKVGVGLFSPANKPLLPSPLDVYALFARPNNTCYRTGDVDHGQTILILSMNLVLQSKPANALRVRILHRPKTMWLVHLDVDTCISL